MFNTGINFLTAPPYKFLLDQLNSGANYGNFSLRKLRSAYTGSAIRIRRTSDNTEADIGFVANLIDVSAINSFCSGTTCRVKTWYDQGGGAYNFSQTTQAEQPYIYQNGSIETLNARPCIFFDANSNTSLQSLDGWLYNKGNISYNHVGAIDNIAGSNSGVLGPYNTYLQGFEYLLHNIINIPTLLRLNGGSSRNDNTTDFFYDNILTISEIYMSANIQAYRDNTSLVLDDDSWSSTNLNYNGKYAMMMYAGACSTGRIFEWNFFDQDIHGSRNILYKNQNEFYF